MILGNSAFTDESQQEIASTEQTFINKLVQDKKEKQEKPQNQLLIVQTSYLNQLVYGA